MNIEKSLVYLQNKNNSLKSQLLHEQLKYGNYQFNYYKKYSMQILIEYKKSKSLYKAALKVGIDYKTVMNWFIQGQITDSIFKPFSLVITKMNADSKDSTFEIKNEIQPQNDISDGEYLISEYGDGWSYKTFINGEKVFIISSELETLKKKVKNKHLPLG